MAVSSHKLGYLIVVAALITSVRDAASQDRDTPFAWPDGKKAAISLSFDDARLSQVEIGTGLFDRHDAKVTFYVLPGPVEENLQGWQRLVQAGHEIGNHSTTHPCTGNFAWSRANALEDYTVDRMRDDLSTANSRIEKLLGVVPRSFAYPCGQTNIGRGRETQSYVPLVAELFASGRGWLGEGPNDPRVGDLYQILGMSMDAKNFDEILPILDDARETGRWVVFAGHEIGHDGHQTTRVAMLEDLLAYTLGQQTDFWVAPVGTVVEHIRGHLQDARP